MSSENRKRGRERGSNRRDFGPDAFEQRDFGGRDSFNRFDRPAAAARPQRSGFGGGREQGNNLGTAHGVVKFFNPSKGFGFISRDEGGDDVFVHISAVEAIGLSSLAEGQPLSFTLVERNGRVSATDLVIEGEVMEPQQRERRAPPSAPAGVPGERYAGTVKFFNTEKGFGFISREDGGQDAFVHISAVERSGMFSLQEGQRVSFELETDRRGKTSAVRLQAA